MFDSGAIDIKRGECIKTEFLKKIAADKNFTTSMKGKVKLWSPTAVYSSWALSQHINRFILSGGNICTLYLQPTYPIVYSSEYSAIVFMQS